jgi:hypothetical protein
VHPHPPPPSPAWANFSIMVECTVRMKLTVATLWPCSIWSPTGNHPQLQKFKSQTIRSQRIYIIYKILEFCHYSSRICQKLAAKQPQTRSSGTVRQGRRHGPSFTFKILLCWVTLLQPARRAALLGLPFSYF